jgi:hypothetical protein
MTIDERSAAAWQRFGMKCSGPGLNAADRRLFISRGYGRFLWKFSASLFWFWVHALHGRWTSWSTCSAAGWTRSDSITAVQFETWALYHVQEYVHIQGLVTDGFGRQWFTWWRARVQDHAICISLLYSCVYMPCMSLSIHGGRGSRLFSLN